MPGFSAKYEAEKELKPHHFGEPFCSAVPFHMRRHLTAELRHHRSGATLPLDPSCEQ